ncbi:hypothetical protein FXB61_004504 [Bacillus cereus]|uniref:hypothetical protein n=1 Tax=Bacillus cereus TaxID=1396 RepID=UPI00122D1C0D|nr:hypothetical protein [Bacillus cereus]EKS7875510.1 hypothetical protein [Bacillus cereus]KAA1804886.1 hypothetical protein FXB61_004504 [Bacillus cereus]
MKMLTRNMEKIMKNLNRAFKKKDINTINMYLDQGFEISGVKFFNILKSKIYDIFGEDVKKIDDFLEVLKDNCFIRMNFPNEYLEFCNTINVIYKEFLPIYQKSRLKKKKLINNLKKKDHVYIKSILYYFEQIIFKQYKTTLHEKCLEIYSHFLFDMDLLITSIEISEQPEVFSSKDISINFIEELIVEYSLLIEFRHNFFDLLSGRYNLSRKNNCYIFKPSENNIDIIEALYEANRELRKMISLQKKGEILTRSSMKKTSLEFMYSDFGYKLGDKLNDGMLIQDICNVWISICDFVNKTDSSKSMWISIKYEEIIKNDLQENISKEKFYKVVENYFVSNGNKSDLYVSPIQKYKSQYIILNWGTDIEMTYLLHNVIPKVKDKHFYETTLFNDLKAIKKILFNNNSSFRIFPQSIEFKDFINESFEIDLMFIYDQTLFISEIKHITKKFDSLPTLRKLNYAYDGIIQVDYICRIINENKDLFINKLKKEKNIDLADFKEVKGFLLTNEAKFGGVKFDHNIPILTREDLWRYFAHPTILKQARNANSYEIISFIIKHWWDFSKTPSLKSFLNYLDNSFKDNFAYKEYISLKKKTLHGHGCQLIYQRHEIDLEKIIYNTKKYSDFKYAKLIHQKIRATRNFQNNFYALNFTEKTSANNIKDVIDISHWIELANRFSKYEDYSNRR